MITCGISRRSATERVIGPAVGSTGTCDRVDEQRAGQRQLLNAQITKYASPGLEPAADGSAATGDGIGLSPAKFPGMHPYGGTRRLPFGCGVRIRMEALR